MKRARYPRLRASFLEKHPNDQRRWTETDEAALDAWPSKTACELAAELGRTKGAVLGRIRLRRRLDVERFVTISQLATELGVTRYKIRRAMEALGIKRKERRVAYRRGWRKGPRWTSLGPLSQERIKRHLERP